MASWPVKGLVGRIYDGLVGRLPCVKSPSVRGRQSGSADCLEIMHRTMSSPVRLATTRAGLSLCPDKSEKGKRKNYDLSFHKFAHAASSSGESQSRRRTSSEASIVIYALASS